MSSTTAPPSAPGEQPPVAVRPRLRPGGWALLAGAGLIVAGLLSAVLVVLIAVLGTLSQQRDLTRVLLHRADPSLQRAPRLLTQAGPVLNDARPVLQDARPVLKAARAAIPRARRTARQTQKLLSTAQPLLTGLTGSLPRLSPLLDDLGPTVGDLRPIAHGLRQADLPALITQARPLLSRLADADLGGLLSDVHKLSSKGNRALPAVLSLITELDHRQLLRRLSRTLPMIGSLNQLQQAALKTVRQTLALTSDVDDQLHQSLDIQRKLLSHVEAIDRKIPGPTGG